MAKGIGNRSRANLILGTVFVIFVLATVSKLVFRGNFYSAMLAFTAECALVGGIADWFAVTALFKKPLGFPWHTAIIPKNRDMIVGKVSELVGSELLSVEAIRNSLGSVDLADIIIGKLSGGLGEVPLESRIADFFNSRAGSLDKGKISEGIDSFIKDNLKKQDVSESIRNLLVRAFDEGKQQDWLKALLDKAVEVAGRPDTRERIYKVLKEQERRSESSSQAGSFFVRTLLNLSKTSRHSNLFSVAELLQQELVAVLRKMSQKDDPIFQKLSENSAELIRKLDEGKLLTEAIQTWKNGILDNVGLLETLEVLVSSAVESANSRDEAAGWIAELVDSYKEELGNDEKLRKWLSDLLKSMLERIIISEHHMISDIARETLESFTNERLIKFIEDKAGEDLQWIRINGSIVGAAAGLAIYLFTNLFYTPYAVPVIHRLLGI